MQFNTPTPIQAQAIPAGLAGKDIVGTAQTGTGKTAAFGIPFLSALYAKPGTKGLVLAPTRELAAQIHKVLRQIARGSGLKGSVVVGGESFSRQANEMSAELDYIVATPGRLNDHLQEGTCSLGQVGVLVLDEVDRMLDMGFLPQIRNVLKHVPNERQTMLFSATLPSEVQRFVDTLVRNPIRIAIGNIAIPTGQVEEKVVRLQNEQKTATLLETLQTTTGKTIVFVRTQSRAHRLVRALDQKGFDVGQLHGGRTQGQRKIALERFRTGAAPILIATDLAGRGIDVIDIEHVINFDVPATREDYIHRIGRTGRAGNKGCATSFLVIGDRDQEAIVYGKRSAAPLQQRANRPVDPNHPRNTYGTRTPPRSKTGVQPANKRRFR